MITSPEVGGFAAGGLQRAVSDPQIQASFQRAFEPYCFAMPLCDFRDPYRRTDGQCNNPINPLLGSSFTPQQRVVPNAYDDCKSYFIVYASKAFFFCVFTQKTMIET